MFGPKNGPFPFQLNCALYDYETTKRRGAAFCVATHGCEMVNSFHFPWPKCIATSEKKTDILYVLLALKAAAAPDDLTLLVPTVV